LDNRSGRRTCLPFGVRFNRKATRLPPREGPTISRCARAHAARCSSAAAAPFKVGFRNRPPDRAGNVGASRRGPFPKSPMSPPVFLGNECTYARTRTFATDCAYHCPPRAVANRSRVECLRNLPECPCARLLRLDDRQYVRRVPVSFGLHGGHGTRTRWLSHCASLDYPNEPGAASFPCDEHAADHISDTDVVRRLALFPSRANSRMVTPEAPLCGARRRTWLDPPLDEMVLDLPD